MKLIKLSDNILCDHCENQIPPWQIMSVIVCPLKNNATMGSYPLSYITKQPQHSQAVGGTIVRKLHSFIKNHQTEEWMKEGLFSEQQQIIN